MEMDTSVVHVTCCWVIISYLHACIYRALLLHSAFWLWCYKPIMCKVNSCGHDLHDLDGIDYLHVAMSINFPSHAWIMGVECGIYASVK